VLSFQHKKKELPSLSWVAYQNDTCPRVNMTALVFFLKFGSNFKDKNGTESGLMIPQQEKEIYFCWQ